MTTTTGTTTDRSPRRHWWSGAPVRVRLTVLFVLMTIAALILSGVTAYLLQRASVHERIENALGRTVTELNLLSQNGVVPDTGKPISSASELIEVAMVRTLPVRNEGLLGLENGRATLGAADAVELRLEDDPELVAWALEREDSDVVRISTLTTRQTTYRAAVVPVGGTAAEDRGALLVAFDVEAEIDELQETYSGYALAALLSTLVVVLLAWFLLRRVFTPLDQLSATVRTITERDLSRRVPVTGHDDVAKLSTGFNEMLERLEAAFSSQRQLLDDVGHELRTPITIVQGNLEVMDPEDSEDVRESMDISLDELQRMRRLVDDLVLLAKTARPDFVAPEAVDVAALTSAVLEKAAQLGEREWLLESAAETTAMLDVQRITQAWLQLASNAVRYSEDGTRVQLGTAIAGDTLRLWVRDQGIGVAQEDRERIFERFGHGASTRQEGSGLGLTIVSAIAAAHGGHVSLESVEGTGSVFTMEIPLRTPPKDRAPEASTP
ncbi:HAMP domain-containing histidine kinase [Micrococcus lylae]|uniref:sensor histidine kinase n=1 Tax=Micrococcus lylae TaxID=1273 RepID=UPI0021A5EC0B|nr:HAMP domain-containing sensor histidine kinase [Micrococcus lylae]MCT2006713.1 HAMP domain-containing histidine kinase [Micrococcus lylae]MCT2070595.1 HAMP domain-containing histidine kinase [Micrococcus lylae]